MICPNSWVKILFFWSIAVHRLAESNALNPSTNNSKFLPVVKQHVVSKGRLRKMALQLGDKTQNKREGPGERSRAFLGL